MLALAEVCAFWAQSSVDFQLDIIGIIQNNKINILISHN